MILVSFCVGSPIGMSALPGHELYQRLRSRPMWMLPAYVFPTALAGELMWVDGVAGASFGVAQWAAMFAALAIDRRAGEIGAGRGAVSSV
jgi:hypothetical protein